MLRKAIVIELALMLMVPFYAIAVDARIPQQIPVWVPPNTEKVLRDQPFPAPLADQVLWLEAAKNEYESGQIVIKGGSAGLSNVSAGVSELKQTNGAGVIAQSSIQLFKQHYVHVTQPSTTLPSGWYPDALIPLGVPFNVPSGQNQGITLTVQVPKGQSPGVYSGVVTLKSGTATTLVPIVVNVWDFELSDEKHTQSAFAIWGNEVALAHQVAVNSPAYWTLMENYYDMLQDYRVDPTDLPIPSDDVQQFIADATPYLQDPKVASFRIPYYNNDPVKTKQMTDALRTQGWLDKGYFYLEQIDEPPPSQYPLVQQLSAELQQIASDAKHLVTKEPVSELYGYVNTWAPPLHMYNESTAKLRQAAGEHVWWYTAVTPKRPSPSYHIDDDLLGARMLSWMQKRYDVEGNLYWSATVFRKFDGTQYVARDVWNDPLAYPGANGDGFLLYPGYDLGINGPVATVRLDAIRDGMEDYEYLWLLEQKMTQAAADLGVAFDASEAMQYLYDRLFLWTDDFNRDPEQLLAARREVAERIVALDQSPQALIGVKPTGPSSREISVYTAQGTTVSINGAAQSPMAQTAQHVKYAASLQMNAGLNEVAVVVAGGGVTRTIAMQVYLPYEIELNELETANELNRWTADDVQKSLSNAYVSRGSQAMKAVYGTTAAFPNLRLFDAGAGFRYSDWSKFKALEFDVYNPNNAPVEFNVKFFQTNQQTDDAHPVIASANGWTRAHILLSDLRDLDLTQMKGIELWMRKPTTPATLYFDHFRFIADGPRDSMSLFESALNKLDTAQELARWSASNVSLGLAAEHATQGQYAMKAVYAPGVDFPNLKLMQAGVGFHTADWSPFKTIQFDVFNPSDSDKIVNVKFYETTGLTDDNHPIAVPAHSGLTVSIPLSEVNLDLTQIKGLEVWMWNQPTASTLYFDHFRFESESPMGSMEP